MKTIQVKNNIQEQIHFRPRPRQRQYHFKILYFNADLNDQNIKISTHTTKTKTIWNRIHSSREWLS